jgi:glutamate-1-semialdehyde 2,1-aminomutase
VEVAEKIIEMVPCAEKVRFGKNGSDATAGAIRLARAYTGRDHVAVCGYHGWQDWYIGSTARNLGVPGATRSLTHSFVYNDLASLHKIFKDYPDQIAAVIMEPMSNTEPQPGFLEGVKELAHSQGAVFIFDELVTGFRFANGGAQEYFGVVPDLAAFGKGLSNGYPVSAVAGRAEIMDLMEEIFFSFTFGGEVLSLAAANATLSKLQREPVLENIKAKGIRVIQGVQELIEQYDLGRVMALSGHPAWSFITFLDTPDYSQWEIKTLFMQELFARGVLMYGTHNMSYSHSEEDIAYLLKCYRGIFPLIKEVVSNKCLDQYLRCRPLEPLFKLR